MNAAQNSNARDMLVRKCSAATTASAAANTSAPPS